MKLSSIAIIAFSVTAVSTAEAQPTMPASHGQMPQDSMQAPAAYLSLADWTKRVEAEIDKNLVYPSFPRPEQGSGVVRVKFNCTPGGGTQNVSLLRRSGSAAYDREALRVVRKLVQMHPLPTGMTNDQPYEAIILFGSSAGDDYDASRRAIQRESIRRTSWFKGATATVTSAVPNPAGLK